MGFSRKRVGKEGRPKYTAYYLDPRRRQRSAGTFPTRREADRAWQQAEADAAQGRLTVPRRGQVTFASYVNETWFPHHVLEPSTRQSYRYQLDRHILPTFGPMKIGEILPLHVRQWVTAMVAAGVSPATIRHNKIILSAVFTTALNDLVVVLHPCRGVKTPTVPIKEYRILTPAEFRRLSEQLRTPAARLLVDLAVESGLRWGELIELRLQDLHQPSGILTVSRSVAEVQPAFSPTGERFVVKPYPKGRRSRRLRLHPAMASALVEHAQRAGRAATELLFTLQDLAGGPRPRLTVVPPEGWTEANDRGRRYRHGTLSAYTAGRCRCATCRAAFAEYRGDCCRVS